MPIEQLDAALLIGAAVLLAAVLAVRLSVGAGFPSLLIYLGFGVVLGESVLGIPFEDYDVASALGYVALILIPAAFPAILTGLKIGWAFAWRTLIAAELVFGVASRSGGLGWYIF